MFGGFKPSKLAESAGYTRINMPSEDVSTNPHLPAIEDNISYQTDSERLGAVAPFLKRNMVKDHKRRNYVIKPGGKLEFTQNYFNEDLSPDLPDKHTFLGHESAPESYVTYRDKNSREV